MKKFLAMLGVMVVLLSFAFSEELTVYIYESLSWIEGGTVQKFEEMNDCEVKVVKLGDAGNVLTRLVLERKNPRADVVIGLDQSLAAKAVEEDLLIPYKPKNIENVKDKALIFDPEYYVIPYDYGAIAIIYDPEKIHEELESFEDLTKFKNSLIIQDPRASSTGQAFLLWTIAVYENNWKDFWERLMPAILTVSPSWDDSFAKFEIGEAPMMVSYATDSAYSQYYYGSSKYKVFIPKEGAYVQIEGAGIVKGTNNIELAQKFMEFILTEDFQKEIPLNQWMFPVIDVELPEVYQYAVVPEKILTIPAQELSNNLERWLKEWEALLY
ncbi:thiamine ABC transporter substrate-binding protein [Petrotoga olearia]|uniref:ABC transporter substrate-binding protein n=2 Tax=Petrotoga olearia TaxID=156203 RepID=A0A2K1NWK7_9BACT|nr:thiamine ABC transporter substrate-binding protein [Petrotoga olearia]PNR94914.1 ABC transporter substrate-binding protein [Petrotoga olearia DSM 13574]RMA73204.1 thiamine transport system substrate-binding protein [Petrotoga olearia]